MENNKDKNKGIFPELNDPDEQALRLRQEFAETCEAYQKVLGSGLGKNVLADILSKCHFGVTLDPNNPAMIAEYNLGITILALSGWLKQVCLIIGIKYEEVN